MISTELITNLFSSTANQQADYDNLSNKALGRGIDLYMKKDYQSAVKEFKRSIALSPYSEYSDQAYEYLAYAYLSQNMVGDAVKTYQDMLKRDPLNDSAHLNLGNIYFKDSRYNEAEAEYSLAVRINPASAMNRYALGMTYMVTDRFTKAEEQFRRVVQITPRDVNGYDALGQALRKQGRYEDAVVQFRTALGIDRKNADVHLSLGYTYTDMKEKDKAGQEMDILKELDQEKAAELERYIEQAADPKFLAVFSSDGFPVGAERNTLVSTMDPELDTPNASKSFSMTFMFTKDMDPASVMSLSNWRISRATGANPGGAYNFGIPVPSTEILPPSKPYLVTYDEDARTAEVTFRITQNGLGNGTLDPSHLVFSFQGLDAYGNAMDPAGDEYSGVSMIV